MRSGLLTYLGIAGLFFHLPAIVHATPKAKVCRPGICLKTQTAKAKRTQRGLPAGEYLMSVPRIAIAANIPAEFPPDDPNNTPELNIKVPADRTLTYRCTLVAGKMECYDVIREATCPETIRVQDSPGGIYWECRIDCAGDPDREGNCDCDVLYNTCLPLG